MLFDQILCNYSFPFLTTSPTCSEAGGGGDLVSLLIYLRKSSCVVSFKEGKAKLTWKLTLRKAYIEIYNIQLLSPGLIRSLLKAR